MKVEIVLTQDCLWRRAAQECEDGNITYWTGKSVVHTLEKCPRCKGRGKVLTEIGREIVLLVREYVDIESEDL